MHLNHQAFTRNSLKLSYQVIGKGSEPLIAFTGFGKNASELAQKLEKTHFFENFQIYCVDFFFHGASNYPKERIERKQIDKKEFAELFEAFINENNLINPNLLGYSLGGKLALVLLEQKPEIFGKAILLAPDGLHKVWWYRVLLNFPPFRWVYKYYIKHPKWYFWWIRAIQKMGFLHKKAADFAIVQMDTEEKRSRIYNTWMVMKKLEPSISSLQEIENLKDRLLIYLGKYDRIIRPWKGRAFIKSLQLQEEKNLRVLDCGHDFLKVEILQKIANEE